MGALLVLVSLVLRSSSSSSCSINSNISSSSESEDSSRQHPLSREVTAPGNWTTQVASPSSTTHRSHASKRSPGSLLQEEATQVEASSSKGSGLPAPSALSVGFWVITQASTGSGHNLEATTCGISSAQLNSSSASCSGHSQLRSGGGWARAACRRPTGIPIATRSCKTGLGCCRGTGSLRSIFKSKRPAASASAAGAWGSASLNVSQVSTSSIISEALGMGLSFGTH
mmetsp:Transcript_5851/g.12188  ORF Transcript_5851/g.12188 Transcript_5851/m.12188 type:complete len:228 (-) Transcript_5851:80-763(-)